MRNTALLHILLLGMAVASGLSSCSLDRTRSERPAEVISFAPFTDSYTRAQEINNQRLPHIQVYAYDGTGALYFSDLFSYRDASVAWESDVPHYWPSDPVQFTFLTVNSGTEDAKDPLKVFGITPEMDALGTAAYKGVTIPPTASAQLDLVVSRAHKSRNDLDSKGRTYLNFRHALSQVKVRAKNSNPNMRVEVVGVKISYLGGTGDFQFPADATGGQATATSNLLPRDRWSVTAPAAGTYSAFIAKREDVITSTTPVQTLTDQYVSIMQSFSADGATVNENEAFMLLPQQVDAWTGAAAADGAYISVLCRISRMVKDASKPDADPRWEQEFPADAGKFAFTSVPVRVDWNPGFTYTYSLEFFGDGGGGGTADPDPTDPSNPDGPDEGIDPDPGVDPGDPIVGGVISVQLTVDTFKNGFTENPSMN